MICLNDSIEELGEDKETKNLIIFDSVSKQLLKLTVELKISRFFMEVER